MNAFPPLPVRDDWTPAYLKGRDTGNRDFAFRLRDAQGAPSRLTGVSYHSGVDWFAPAYTPVRAPRAGVVTRSEPSRGSSGQVFGGVLAVEEPSGRLWVHRHVLPTRKRGETVAAGDVIATVSPWTGGGTHLHLEIWTDANGGYWHENMMDPALVTWTETAAPEPETPGYYFEELPHTEGGVGPVVRGQVKGYASAQGAGSAAAALRLRGRLVSVMKATDGRWYVLDWKEGTYGNRFRFGPWQDGGDRDGQSRQRAVNTGRVMRPYRGSGSSLYPWPDV